MQKTIALCTAILIGAIASITFAAQPTTNKASEVKNASSPQQTMPSEAKKETIDTFIPRQTRSPQQAMPREAGNSHGGMHGMSH